MNKLSVIVLTKNSEAQVQSLLSNLSFAQEIIFIDDFSTDRTRELAKRGGAKVFLHQLNDNFAMQRNYALKKAENLWVLFIDADEVVSKELACEILETINNTTHDGFYITRNDVLWERHLTHGDNSTALIRLGLRDSGVWQGKVHETWVIKNISTLKHPLTHFPHQNISEFLKEISFYAWLRAEELYSQGVGFDRHLVMFIPAGKFLYLYFIKRGFLDGTPGLISALMMSYYSFLVRARLRELYASRKEKRK